MRAGRCSSALSCLSRGLMLLAKLSGAAGASASPQPDCFMMDARPLMELGWMGSAAMLRTPAEPGGGGAGGREP